MACAEQATQAVGPAARASLFADLGACRFLAGDTAGALAAWQQAAVSGSPAPAARALYNLGRFHEVLGLYERAIELYSSAQLRRVEPWLAESLLATARCHHARGEHAAAIEVGASLTEALMLRRPDSELLARALFGIGQSASAAGRPDRAEQAYRAAASAAAAGDPVLAQEATDALVDLLRANGHHDEAEQWIEQSWSANSDAVRSIDRAAFLLEAHRLDEAVDTLTVIDRTRLNDIERFRLADLLVQVDMVNPAIDELEVLASSETADVAARAGFVLGGLYEDHGMNVEARSMYDSVREGADDYWRDKATLAAADLSQRDGEIERAAELWALAAAGSTELVADTARRRLVAAVAARSVAEPVASDDDEDHLGEAPDSALIIVPDEADLGALDEPTELIDIVELADPDLDQRHADVDPNESEAESEPDLVEPAASAPAVEPAPPIELVEVAESPAEPLVVELRRTSSERTFAAAINDADADSVGPAEIDQPAAAASAPPATPLVVELRARSRRPVPPPSQAVAPPVEPAPADDDADQLESVIDLTAADVGVGSNPYASLAPRALDNDPAPSPHNPYAELAPNFDDGPSLG